MSDAELIDRAGGPSAFAQRLSLLDKGAVQRVSNWKRRGIPARIRLVHRKVFDELERPGTEGARAVPVTEPATQET